MPWPDSAASPGDFRRDGEDDGSRAAAYAMATVHPSAVLRADDQDTAFAALVADLTVAATALA
jgi:DNA polymerase